MSTLDATYVPLSAGLSNYGIGPEATKLGAMLADALSPLGRQNPIEPAIHDLYTLGQESEIDEGATLTAEMLEISKRFLLAWPKTLPAPELALDRDGEVTFDWSASHRRMFSVSLRSDGRVSYAGRLSARRTIHGTEAFDDSVPKQIVEAVKQLYI